MRPFRSFAPARSLALAIALAAAAPCTAALLPALTPRPAAAQQASTQVLTGRVLDARTGEALPGATAQLVGTRHGAIADAAGVFRIALEPGETRTRVRVTLVGYEALEVELPPAAAQGGFGVVAATPTTVRLTAVAIPVAGAEVSSILAREGASPSAFTSLERKDLESAHYGQDLPMLLAPEVPNVYAYSDAGNGIGYSYLKIRGFAQRRIGVTINGIPLNDPLSREVYWIDHPDFATSAQEIQVQRGVGSSVYGTTALGGSVNVETVPFRQDRELVLDAGYGSFDTRRFSVQAASGLLDNKYSLQARLSRILTDGYRDQSWSDLWSYFVGIARVDRNMVTRLNLYGGPENTHLSYLGVSRDYLDGRVTGDAAQDRRFNPLTYAGEQDRFFEPHYELLHDWKLSDRTSLSNALFYFRGYGSYDEFRAGEDLRQYAYPESVITDLVRRRTADNFQLGWVPRLRHDWGEWRLETGLEVRYAEGRRFGEVLWAAQQPAAGAEPDHRYYDYVGKVTNTSGFARLAWTPRAGLRLTGDLALHHQVYELADDRYTGYSFREPYTFLMPRVGANVDLVTRDEGALRRLEAYGSFSRANAEPIFRELYDAETTGAPPGFATIGADGTLSDPLLSPEQVYDWELGLRGRGSWGEASLGGYYMKFRDEIVYNGQIDDNGNPISGNAASSRHAGLEGSVTANAGSHVELGGSFHVADDRFDEYLEYVDATTANDYSGNRIAGFPVWAARARAAVRYGNGRLELFVDHAGRQYLDNTENERKNPSAREDPAWQDRTIEPWTVANATLGWQVPGGLGGRLLELTLRVNNLFDTRYETAGYIDYPAPAYAPTPVWTPAATRNVFVGVRASL